MRLIDADALKPKVEAMVIHRFNESDYEYGGNQAFDYVADILIDEAPTIDAVEVVRCKDCKASRVYGKTTQWLACEDVMEGQATDPNGYCYLGERKEP